MDKQQEETRPEEVIAGSAYFDGKWYAEKYHITQEDPAAHYLNEGWKLGFDPSEGFSTSEYLRRRCDIIEAEINPLLHYELEGKAFWDRFKRITAECDLEGFGLEIAPYFNPTCPKSRGYHVEILDCMDQDSLRRQGERDPNVGRRAKRVEAVDYIWSGEDYRELIGAEERYDYIIASHVIEHTTDLAGFLEQCAALLKENGVLSLAIPDKRYCFDFFWEDSSPSKVIDKYMANDKSRHSKGSVIEVWANAVKRNQEIYAGDSEYRPKDAFTVKALQYKRLQPILEKDEYLDVHEWVFTPASFRILVNDLQEIGLIENLSEAAFHPTEGKSHEFFISFRKTAVPDQTDASARLARRTMLRHERLQEDIDFYTKLAKAEKTGSME